MRGWKNDSLDVRKLLPTGNKPIDPLPRRTITNRGLCLARLEFLLDTDPAICNVCVVASPCNHMNVLQFVCPNMRFHVFQCESDETCDGVSFHVEEFSQASLERLASGDGAFQWILFGSGDETLDYHRRTIGECKPTGGFLIVVQDLEPSLPTGNLVYPLWGPFDARTFLLENKRGVQDPENRKMVQGINMAMLLVELNHFHREIRRYRDAYDESREEHLLSRCVDSMGLRNKELRKSFAEFTRNFLPPKPEQEASILLQLLFPKKDISAEDNSIP